MNQDFILIEASLLAVKDPETQKKLYEECQNHRVNIQRLIIHYQKILERQQR